MENKIEKAMTTWADTALAKIPFQDRVMAAGIIIGNYAMFYKTEADFDDNDKTNINNIVRKHIYTNGEHGAVMAARVGKAMKASIENPLKKSNGPVSKFKRMVKELLS